ncbi:hypothetical protein RRF57_006158 [Xylaria bambusicola]|uniref:Aflatoxin regulatory protein domain-containing protein n=1 Tax=Xylaria bambusicola TaxID=326684 RepID=A0AAN7Z8N8_9PEZI
MGRTRASVSEKEGRESVKPMVSTQQITHPPGMAMSWTTVLPGATHVPTTLGSPHYQDIFPSSASFTGEPVMSSPLAYDPCFLDRMGVSVYRSMFNSIDNANNTELGTSTACRFTESNPHHPIVPMPMPNLLRDTNLDPSIISNATQPFFSPVTNTHIDIPTISTDPPLQPPCSCLLRGFKLLQQLHPNRSNIAILNEQYTSGCTQTSQQGTKGKQCFLEEITSMVKCTCSEDPDLLSHKSLIAFKIMSLFKITSRELEKPSLPNGHNPNQHMGENPQLEGRGYSSGVCVEDLHRIRQLASSLSLWLRRLRADEPIEERAISDIRSTNYVPAADKMDVVGSTEYDKGFVPYSLLRQMEVELRRILQSLLIEIGEDGHQGNPPLYDSNEHNVANC